MDKKRIQELSGFQNLIESIRESTGVGLQPVKKENILRGQNTVSAGEKKHKTIYAKH